MLSSDPSTTLAALRFGRFELKAVDRQLLIDGRPAVLGARAFDLLVALAERPGALVSKNDLLDRVWPGQVVEENNIAVQVNALRKLLGGDLIGTVPGRGYRFTARIEGSTVAAPALPVPTPALQTHLPRVLPRLLGRVDDLGVIGALVDAHPLVSVIGAGGIGKTLLVQHLLDSRRSAYRHGVCWVELANVVDAAALPSTLATALGVRLGSGDALEALALAIGPLDLLLALDNAEHLVADVGRLSARLVDAAPGLKLVVTSQVPLKVAAERVMRLDTLDLPPLGVGVGVAQGLASGAVALFVERAQAADARFTLTDANVAAVVGLCHALDGHALSIELAAARAPMLGVHGLVDSMGDRLQLLTRSRNRAAPARQQTLRATLEWSHGFLDATEQAVFRRLALVSGSCSLQLAQWIAADAEGEGPIDAWAVVDALDVLVDRSLAVVLAGDDDASPRYRLLESPQAFALERLAAAGEAEATRRRLTEALAGLFAAAWDTYFSGTTTISRLRHLLAPDFDNARAAVASEHCPASLRLQIASLLQRALPRTLLAERLALADACESLLNAEPSLELRMLGWLSAAWTWVNSRRQRSRAAVERAVALAREHEGLTGDRRYLHTALGVSAFAMALNHEVDSAGRALAEMQAIENAGWSSHLMWRADAAMIVAGLRGDYAERLRVTRERVTRWSESEDDVLLGLSNLIDSELAAGDAHAAAATGRTLVSKLVSGRDEYMLTLARLNLCAALLALDGTAEARAVAEAGWSQARRFELQACWADYLALLAALEQRPAVAARLCGFSTAAYASIDELREVNEAAAFNRACRLASGTLGDPVFEHLQTEGRSLRHEDVAAIAFGPGDG